MAAWRGILGIVLLIAATGSACSPSDDALDVFAAASLTNAFGELGDAFEAEHGVEVRFNFAGSSSLREQILDGAEADVFASANPAVLEALRVEGAVEGDDIDFAANTIVLAIRAADVSAVPAAESLATVLADRRLVGACARGVPCGDLADAVVAAVGVEVEFVTRESDVRSVARRLEDGELDAAFVYRSDVVASSGALVEAWAPTDPIGVTNYPIAAIESSPDAQAFIEFVAGPRGTEILARWGFDG